ncbi:MAG: ATP-binding cassette domain-containing protein [Pseudomonadota bacterium]
MTSALEVTGLTVHAGAKRLLGPVSFAVPTGETLVIMGETGAGKSLLAQAILGALPEGLHADGAIMLDGRRIDGLSSAERAQLWGRAITLLPQEPWRALDPLMASGAQVTETYRFVAGLEQTAARRAATRDLESLGLAGAENKRPGQLSGGMAQRAAFAAARAGGADLLLADEPTKGLDKLRAQAIVDLLKVVPVNGGALLAITHEVAVARDLGGSLLMLKDGAVVEQGETADVLAAPRSDYGKALLAADPTNWTRPATAASDDEVLRAEDLTIIRGGQHLLDGFELSLAAGERIAITGPSGAGKTTLLDTLAGLLPPAKGHVTRGHAVTPTGIQKIYQDPPAAFPPRITLGRNLQDVAALHDIDWPMITQLLTRLRVDQELLARRPDQVSGGELQRIAIARALAVAPSVLLADEPTSRLDPITQADTMELLAESTTETGTAVVLVTHDAAMAANWAGRQMTVGSQP